MEAARGARLSRELIIQGGARVLPGRPVLKADIPNRRSESKTDLQSGRNRSHP